MNFRICSLFFLLAAFSFPASLCDPYRFCPDFTATFTAVVDQTVDDPNFLISDPEQTFFKEIMGFRDNDIQHAFENAVEFFDERYGLDFSLSQPNEQNEYVVGNATLSLFRFPKHVHYLLVLSNWIQTGNTRFSCRDIYLGGYIVTFSGDQLLHGSYGGADGKPVGAGNSVEYGFMSIDACEQSPVFIQYTTPTPFRQEPVDGTFFINLDLYNNVLGYGKAQESIVVTPDENNPGKFHVSIRNVFTFPAN